MKLAVIICGGNLQQITEAKGFFEGHGIYVVPMSWPNFRKLEALRREYCVAACILDSQVEWWQAWLRRNNVSVQFARKEN